MRDWLDVAAWLDWLRGGDLGDRGERAAERFLKRKGYAVVARQQRSHLGEIDLIAVDGETIVFVEVKTRRGSDKGDPIEAVDSAKQQKLTRLALAFLKRRKLLGHSARFDVVAVLWPDESSAPEITHYPDAFPPVGHDSMFS
ncbi:MAG: YraN family protein [Planctomycetales bacterium]